jgi:hypothetical protein
MSSPVDDILVEEEDPIRFKRTMADFIARKMMFVSGETVEPAPDTTTLVEQIVQQQVMEMVCRTAQCNVSRGSQTRSSRTAPLSQHAAVTAPSRRTT